MEVTETITEGLKREFKVIISASEIDTKVDERLKEIAPTLQLPGFRPGKVPPALVKKRFGQSLLGEVLEKSVNESSQKTLDERGLRPAAQPNIEVVSFDEGKDLEFNLSVELMPEIKPVDFSEIKLEKLVAEANENDIDEALSKLAEQHKGSEPIQTKRASKNGDIVVIGGIKKNNVASGKDGVPGVSKIPVVGKALSGSNKSDTMNELLVFIAPRIL